jgi:hypothetical protein
METIRLLARYGAIVLAIIGGLEWLLGRTVSRLAAAPNLEGTPRAVVEGIGKLGIDLLAPSFLLALVLLFLSAITHGAQAIKDRDIPALAAALVVCIFGSVAAAASFIESAAWLSITFNAVSLLSMLVLVIVYIWRSRNRTLFKLGVVLSVLGYLGWYSFVLRGELPDRGQVSGLGLFILDAGEMLLVTVPLVLFWALCIPNRQWRHPARWILPVVAMLVFATANVVDMISDQGFTGVFSLWSVGYTLFLPWPLYALALGAFLYAVLTCFASGGEKALEANPNTGLALLLFLFAGYNLQLTYQHLLAVLALVLLTGMGKPFGAHNKREGDEHTPVPGGLVPESTPRTLRR